MDTSVLSLLISCLFGFLIFKWFIHSESHPSTTNLQNDNNIQQRQIRIRNTNVNNVITLQMIQTVQNIAPDLHVEQIRYDLQQSGSIEATIEKYLNGHRVVFPPNYIPSSNQ